MKVSQLDRRISRLTKIFPYTLPDWFPANATREERERWIYIQKTYRGFERMEYEAALTKELRLRYPSMPFSIGEQIASYGHELETDEKLRRSEGLDPNYTPQTPQEAEELLEYAKQKSRALRKHP